MIAAIGADRRYRYVNAGFARIVGSDAPALVGARTGRCRSRPCAGRAAGRAHHSLPLRAGRASPARHDRARRGRWRAARSRPRNSAARRRRRAMPRSSTRHRQRPHRHGGGRSRRADAARQSGILSNAADDRG
ncbi:hypothetical protein AB5I41_23745 [Sphingomonas sp. MMS24-JH45]